MKKCVCKKQQKIIKNFETNTKQIFRIEINSFLVFFFVKKYNYIKNIEYKTEGTVGMYYE